MGFGARVRELRKEAGLSLRELASRVGIDFTYLSKVELEHVDPPSDRVICDLARELGADEEEMLALAAKVSQADVREVVERVPEAGIVFRRLQSGELSASQIKRMLEITEEEAGAAGE